MTEPGNSTKRRSVRSHRAYPVLYMFAVTLFFSGILIGLNQFTRGRVAANRRIFFERAVLTAAGFDVDSDTPSVQIHAMFTERIKPPDKGSGGAYRAMQDENLKAYALPFEGQGFWNVIKGVLGIEPDGQRLIGIAFHEQNETPGLGAEIVKPYFRQQFNGLQITTGTVPIRLVPTGSTQKKNEIHAITGATRTCARLENILNDALENWQRKMRNIESEAQ